MRDVGVVSVDDETSHSEDMKTHARMRVAHALAIIAERNDSLKPVIITKERSSSGFVVMTRLAGDDFGGGRLGSNVRESLY